MRFPMRARRLFYEQTAVDYYPNHILSSDNFQDGDAVIAELINNQILTDNERNDRTDSFLTAASVHIDMHLCACCGQRHYDLNSKKHSLADLSLLKVDDPEKLRYFQ